jgi:hypothetical protein
MKVGWGQAVLVRNVLFPFQERFSHDHSIPIGKQKTKKRKPATNHGNGWTMPDTNGLLISLAITAVIGLAAVGGFAWLMSSVINHRDQWRAGGAAFTPLQEMIQPKVRHVVEAQEQRVEGDENGAPDND